MSTLVSSLSELLALVVQSFNLAAVLPAFVFVLLNHVFVRPMLENWPLTATVQNTDESTTLLLLVALVVALAYFMTALNTLIIRCFEGYPFMDQYPFDTHRQQHLERVRFLTSEIAEVGSQISQLDKEARKRPLDQRSDLRKQQTELESYKQFLLGEQLFHYPQNEARVVPTKLGNIIASAEDYPEQLFGIDSVLMWPYLVPTLTTSGYAKFVEREKSIFDLLLNSTVLMAVFWLELLCLGPTLLGFSLKWGLTLALIGAAVWALGYLATHGAMGWALTIRAAFVLHRNGLREALGLAIPHSYSQERTLWENVCRFYREPVDAPDLADETRIFAYPAERRAKSKLQEHQAVTEIQDGKENQG